MPIPKKIRPENGLSRREQAIEERHQESLRQYSDVSEAARKHAQKLYKRGKFHCSEAVFSVVNDHLGQPADSRMVKMASGFPVGIGMSGCICGAVAGGVMALGLKYGREQQGDTIDDDLMPLSAELHDRFQRRNCSTCCRKLIKHLDFGSAKHIQQCIKFTGEVAADVVDLIENGVEGYTVKQQSEDCNGCMPEPKTSHSLKHRIFQTFFKKMSRLKAII